MQWKIWIGAAASVLLLCIAARDVDLDALATAARHVRPSWLAVALAAILARSWLVAVRWHVLLRPAKHVPVHRLFGVTMVGFMASNLLPFRIGELVRAYVLGRSESLPTSLSLATILLERVLDGLTLLGFLAVGLLFLRGHPWLFWSAAGASILYLGVLGMLLALSGRRAEGIVSRVGALLPLSLRIRTAALAQSFATGLTVLRTPAALATALMLSLLVWLVTASAVQATFVALSLELPAYAGGLVLAVIALALTLPSAPGQIGTFQFGAVAGLALFAVPASRALSLGILFHALNYIPVTALGLVYLSSLGLTFREIHTAAHRASA